MKQLRFDGRVAVVTGAGNGLGKAYALELARRGAQVVVNDLGGSLKGQGGSAAPADQVVEEIIAAGGQAVANYDSVLEGSKVVDAAVKSFGRIDIVINNAGILRDVSFKRMSEQDWDAVMAVHLKGAFSVTRAAWDHMLKQKYGRIIGTASIAGLMGNVGQANYATAKMGMLGFTQTLAKEGQKNNIHANSVAPFAGTRMMASVQPPEVNAAMALEHVVPLTLYLCHESCQVTGETFEVGAGAYLRVQIARGKGWINDGEPKTMEDVAANIKQIRDMTDPEVPDIFVGLGKNAVFENVARRVKAAQASKL